MEADSKITLKSLVGLHTLSGIEIGAKEMLDEYGYNEIRNYVRFCLDGNCYQIEEDPDDGYRSYATDLHIVEEKCKYSLPNIQVCCVYDDVGTSWSADILKFADISNGEFFLRIGTDGNEDWYPMCVLEYTPEKLSINGYKR